MIKAQKMMGLKKKMKLEKNFDLKINFFKYYFYNFNIIT